MAFIGCECHHRSEIPGPTRLPVLGNLLLIGCRWPFLAALSFVDNWTRISLRVALTSCLAKTDRFAAVHPFAMTLIWLVIIEIACSEH
ncbi:hypothetical protein BKA66DRAFT_456649, partial [Pyrenochaeta sp. MPI-SDFR-AT-0127]